MHTKARLMRFEITPQSRTHTRQGRHRASNKKFGSHRTQSISTRNHPMSYGYGYKGAHSFTHASRPILVSLTRYGRLGELPQG
jgi:hypothetical protein